MNARQKEMESIYPEVRQMYLRMCDRVNMVCPITHAPITMQSDIHHRAGRSVNTYADDWARIHDIPLLIDPRFFLACTRAGHEYIEKHPEEAISKNWSVSRLKNAGNMQAAKPKPLPIPVNWRFLRGR